MLEFRVLGDFEVLQDGRPLDVGHARQKATLAALLVDANRIVPLERLIARLWGGDPPQRARESLYSYMSRLRKVLPSEAEIVRHGGGYQLAVDAEAIDMHRFQELVGRARAASGDRDTAVTLLRQALELWRGEPFHGLDFGWLDDLRTTLESERFTVELDHNDLRLAQGEHSTLVGSLREQSSRFPFDERLCGQLMLALYRSGRQAEALETYDALRHRLAEELGSDPVPALRQLHHDILTAQAALPDEPASSARRKDVPRQLPAGPRLFTGREAELDDMDKALDGTTPVWVINGMGGIGKTWMALHWAHRHLDAFGDGQLYVNLRGFDPTEDPLAPEDVLRTLLSGLGADLAGLPGDRDSLAALFRSMVADRRLLILLDNARDAAQVTPLLPGGGQTVTIITSRLDLATLSVSHGARLVSLDILNEDEAHDALVRQLGPERVAAEPEAVAEMLDHCRGLPLALGILASRAASYRHNPLTMLAEELRDTTLRMDSLETGDVNVSLRAVFQTSWRGLSPDAARVFDLLGLPLATDVALPAIASLVRLPTSRTRVLLRELASAHFIEQYRPGRYRMHDLVRRYARERAQDIDEPAAAMSRFVDHYLHTALAARQSVSPIAAPVDFGAPAYDCVLADVPDATAALTWFNLNHHNLLATQRDAERYGWDARVWRLSLLLSVFHRARGMNHAEIQMWEVALRAAERLDDRDARAMSHLFLGQTIAHIGRLTEGLRHLEEALRLAGEAGSPYWRMGAHYALALNHEHNRDYPAALRHSQESLALVRELDLQHHLSQSLNAVGWHHALNGDYTAARVHCLEALDVVGDDALQPAHVYDSLGYIALHEGDHREALSWYTRARDAFRALENDEELAGILRGLARTHDALGEHEAADGCRAESARLYRLLGNDAAADSVLKGD